MAGGIGRNLRDRQVVPLVVPKIADSVGSALRLGERSETGVVLPRLGQSICHGLFAVNILENGWSLPSGLPGALEEALPQGGAPAGKPISHEPR